MALAIAGTIGLAAAVPGFAQDTTPSTRTDTTTSGGMMKRQGDSAAAKSGQSFDKTGQDAWAETQAKQSKGRISRQAYLDEMSRRWDTMDREQQGLTPAEVSRLYGNVDSAAGPARTGTGVQPGDREIRRRNKAFDFQRNGRSRGRFLLVIPKLSGPKWG
jgi:hypothetical protein